MSPNVILDDLAPPNDEFKTIPYQPRGYPGFLLDRGLNGVYITLFLTLFAFVNPYHADTKSDMP